MSSAEIFIQHDEPVQSTEYEASTEQIVQTDKITQADTWLCSSLSVPVRPVSYFLVKRSSQAWNHQGTA